MEWINIHRTTLERQEMMTATTMEAGTWLRLMGYCCGAENGGCIKGARKWSAMNWQRAAMLELEEVGRKSRLWHWKGQDLVVAFYPSAKEREVQAKRVGGSKGGKAKAAHRQAELEASGKLSQKDSASSRVAELEASGKLSQKDSASSRVAELEASGKLSQKDSASSASTEGKGREEKGKEGTPLPPLNAGAEVPEEKTVLDFARSWPGDLSRGIAGPIAEDWVLRWWNWTRNERREFPRDWRDDLARRYVADQVKARRGGDEKPGGRGTVAEVDGFTLDDIDAELQGGNPDPARRAELIKKRAVLRPA